VLLVLLVLLVPWATVDWALVALVAVRLPLIGQHQRVLRLTGSSINTLTLFAMVLATGLWVDDAIVRQRRHIGRRSRKSGDRRCGARNAMQDWGVP